MPGCARREIVRKGQFGIFHVWARCVRRSYLMGFDPLTGKKFTHRRDWVTERLELLVANFVIDVGFFGILSNHLHLVLRTNPRLAKRMGAWEIARRWLRVFPGKRVLDGNWIEPTEEQVKALAEDKERIEVLRGRLSDVSWFMSGLSEYIARRANHEDGVSGRFWEGRFSCREITTERALLICGIYIDLNQIRAGEAVTPESSCYCSVSLRIQGSRKFKRGSKSKDRRRWDGWLAPLTLKPDHLGDVPSKSRHRASDKGLLSMSLEDYLRLLDFAGREDRKGKRGKIPRELAPILERLGMESKDFLSAIGKFPHWFRRFAGDAEQFVERAKEIGRASMHGISHARRIFK